MIVGVLLFMIGLLGVGLNIIESVGISIAIYVGIKVFVGRRKKILHSKFGEGLCLECGEIIIGKKCPNCDIAKK